jgi:hypothetical protein
MAAGYSERLTYTARRPFRIVDLAGKVRSRPTWCHLLFYFIYYALNMLQPATRTPPNISRSKNCKTQRSENKTTDVVIHQQSRRLLKMDILMSETCWAHNNWNKITSDIKLVSFLNYVGNYLSVRHGITSKKASIFSNTDVKTWKSHTFYSLCNGCNVTPAKCSRRDRDMSRGSVYYIGK